jgi:AcrR family transcriptional regulator
VPREGIETKQKLLRAGEQLFARDGVDGARTRDIVARAGQANDSAVHYHFGSRQGLLAAILDAHIQRMEAVRKRPAAGGPQRIGSLVRDIVEPVADELRTEDGRDFLRIIATLTGRSDGRAARAAPLRGTILSEQLERLETALHERVGVSLAGERIALMISMLTAALAERAVQIEDRVRLPIRHDAYVANLVAMLTAAVRAPAPTAKP